MASSAAYARSRARVVRIRESAADAMALRLQLAEEIRQVVGFDAYAWLSTDPETSVGSAPLADVPTLPELPRLIRLEYLTQINRWTTLIAALVASLQGTTGGDLSRSRRWRELLCRYGIGDVASVVHRDRLGHCGFRDLWRSDSTTQFSQADIGYLTAITAPAATSLRRCRAGTLVLSPSGDAGRNGPVVLLSSPDLDVLPQTGETHGPGQCLPEPDPFILLEQP